MKEHQLYVATTGAEYVPYNQPGYPLYGGKGSLGSFEGMGAINHWHWDLEFLYILTGKVSYTVNQKTLTLGAGEGIFVNSGQIHRNFSLDGSDGEYLCVLIHPSALQTVFQRTGDLLNALCTCPGLPYALLRPEIPWQKEILESTRLLYEKIQSGIEENLFAILSVAFAMVHTLSCHLPQSFQEEGNAHGLNSIREMMGFIQTHYAEKLLVTDIARAGKVGSSTCHGLFREFLQMSPMQYLLEYRLEKAAQFLKDTRISMSEIAERTGFASPSYFAECFRAKYALSPTAFRSSGTLGKRGGE